jgi:hypothetical protein
MRDLEKSGWDREKRRVLKVAGGKERPGEMKTEKLQKGRGGA